MLATNTRPYIENANLTVHCAVYFFRRLSSNLNNKDYYYVTDNILAFLFPCEQDNLTEKLELHLLD